MSNGKWTPGPWQAEGQKVIAPEMPVKRFGADLEYQRPYIITQAHLYTDTDRETANANARLIAAAPSMLALLERALPIIEAEAERREQSGLGFGDQAVAPYWTEMSELANEIAAMIAKARKAPQ